MLNFGSKPPICLGGFFLGVKKMHQQLSLFPQTEKEVLLDAAFKNRKAIKKQFLLINDLKKELQSVKDEVKLLRQGGCFM